MLLTIFGALPNLVCLDSEIRLKLNVSCHVCDQNAITWNQSLVKVVVKLDGTHQEDSH
jgi:hypothetical protein